MSGTQTRPYQELGDYATAGELFVRTKLSGPGVMVVPTSGNPDTVLSGVFGQLAIDLDSGDVYQCTSAPGGTAWSAFGGGGGTVTADNVTIFGDGSPGDPLNAQNLRSASTGGGFTSYGRVFTTATTGGAGPSAQTVVQALIDAVGRSAVITADVSTAGTNQSTSVVIGADHGAGAATASLQFWSGNSDVGTAVDYCFSIWATEANGLEAIARLGNVDGRIDLLADENVEVGADGQINIQANGAIDIATDADLSLRSTLGNTFVQAEIAGEFNCGTSLTLTANLVDGYITNNSAEWGAFNSHDTQHVAEAAATDLATVITLANGIRTALLGYGLLAGA